MAYSYSGNPASSQKDEVRFLIGDTNKHDPLIEHDEEITYLISSRGSVLAAAAAGAEAIGAKFARLANEKVGDVSVNYDTLSKKYLDLAARLRGQISTGVGGGGLIPYAGGISESDKASVGSDADRVPEIFKRHMHEREREQLTSPDSISDDPS